MREVFLCVRAYTLIAMMGTYEVEVPVRGVADVMQAVRIGRERIRRRVRKAGLTLEDLQPVAASPLTNRCLVVFRFSSSLSKQELKSRLHYRVEEIKTVYDSPGPRRSEAVSGR